MSQQTKSESHVSLIIFNKDVDTNEVTKIAGFSPTESWMKGDLIERTLHRRNHSRWVYKFNENTADTIEAKLDRFLLLLLERRNGIEALSKRFDTSIWCTIYTETASPSISLESSSVALLAKLGLPLEIEIYFIGEGRGVKGA